MRHQDSLGFDQQIRPRGQLDDRWRGITIPSVSTA